MKAKKSRMISVMVLMSMLLISVFAHPAAASSGPTIEEYDECELLMEDVEPIEIDLDVGDKYNSIANIKSPSLDFPTTRERPIEVNPDLLSSPKSFEGGSINLNLFENTTFSSTINNVTEFTSGGTSIRLNLEGYDMAYSVLSISNNIVNGLIEIPEKPRTFIIRWDSNSELHFVHEAEVLNHGVITSQSENISNVDYNILEEELSDIELMYDPYQHITVDIMVLYTPAARSSAGGHNNIQSLIGTAVGTANTVFSNSGTHSSLNVVHKGEVSYTESGNLHSDHSQLRQRTDVQELRNEHAADLVIFVTDLTNNQIINGPWGSARSLLKLNDGDGQPDRFSAMVGRQFLVNPVSLYVFTHEVGHLFGCAHHRNDPQPGPRDWGDDWEENDWTAAYHFSVLGIGYQTVMSRNSFTRVHIPFFSTPDEKFEISLPIIPQPSINLPVGNSNCNNARTIRTTKHIVSSYRNYVVVPFAGWGTVSTDPEPLHVEMCYDMDRYTFPRGLVTFTAEPGHNHVFSHWRYRDGDEYVEIGGTELTLFIDGYRHIVAHFVEPQPPVIAGHRSFGYNNEGGYNWIHHITWNHEDTLEDNDGLEIHKYRIYRRLSSSSSFNPIDDGMVYPTQANANGDIEFSTSARSNIRYYYKVRTVVTNNDDFVYSIPSNTISLFGGTGSGGCPYISPWNGTGYQRDNNLLIASEHEYGIVEDNYLLEVPLVPKDGFYSMKIEEFMMSESYFDEVKLYTVDHPEGYRVAITPTGELISYSENPILKSSDTATLAGEPIDINIIGDLDDSLYMAQDSVLTMHFTNISEISDLSEQYVILRSHGYESHESVPDLGSCSIDRWWYAHIKAIGRYEPVRLMGNETTYFDEEYIYPRNHPYYLAVPLPEGLEDGADELIFNISYSGDHYLQFVALTKSVNHSVYVQEAELAKAVFNGEFNVTNRLLETDNDMVKLIPGDEILLNFNIPDPIGEDMERSYMISSVGYYEPYLGRHPTAHNDGSERWSFATQGSVQSSPKVGQDGMIYVGSDDTHLYAVNPDGTVEWSFATDGSLRSSPMIGHDGTIYVGSDDNSLYAVNPDGTERWNFTTGGSITTSPVLSINGTIYMSSTDGYLYAVNPDGTEMWSLNAGDGTTPTIGWNGTIYFGTNSCSDFAFLMSVTPDGYDTRLFTTEGNITTSPAIGWDGTIYFGTEYDRLYAVNPNGTERWNFTATGPIRSTPILSMDGTIYFGSDDGRLYAVNSNGTERWNFTTAAPISSSPSISSEGFVYVGSDDGMLYAIDPDGTEIWSFGTEGAVRSSPRIARDGAIYVGSNDNKLYSIGPYVISYIEQLQMIENDLSANYVLVNDIDASYTVGWNSGDGFAPIGTLEDRFTGTFDGRGYTISGLYIDRPSESGIGLFGNIGASGVVSDVGLVDVDITGSGRVGVLAGRNYGTVSDTYVTGNVSGGGEGIGGLVGFMHTSSLYNSYSTADVSGGTAWVLNNPFGTPNRGFSLTNVQYASWTYTHVHEMGHNMGASHHKEQNVQPGPGLYAFPAQPIMDILIDDIK